MSDPSKLQEEYTRYQFYLQVRRDILEGRLQLAPSTAILLASYTVQCEYIMSKKKQMCLRLHDQSENFYGDRDHRFSSVTYWR